MVGVIIIIYLLTMKINVYLPPLLSVSALIGFIVYQAQYQSRCIPISQVPTTPTPPPAQ